jgi:hypothetical protein
MAKVESTISRTKTVALKSANEKKADLKRA